VAQESRTIEVSYDRTTILIFPSDIPDPESVDAGVGVQAVISGGYRLKLASKKSTGFRNTSLYVELESGHYYLFELIFNNDPEKLIHEISFEEAKGTIHRNDNSHLLPTASSDGYVGTPEVNDQDVSQDIINNTLTVIDRSPNVTGIGVKHRKFITWVESLYIKDNMVYLEMALSNESNMDYEINFIKFTINNKKRGANKVAQQNPEVKPVYVYNGNISTIKKSTGITKVMVFDKLGLSEKQYLLIEIYEKLGSRNVAFKVDSDRIINAKLLP
jgi:hypothetical protein